jgi:hypothetical protein
VTGAGDARPVVVGVLVGGAPGAVGLRGAAERLPGVVVRALQADAPSTPDVDGLIVDADLGERPALLRALVSRWSVPVLVESPVAADVQVVERLVGANRQPVESSISPGRRVVAANPLRYGLHTRRLLEELTQADDPLQTFFAAWRFKPHSSTAEALPRLLDFLRGVCAAEPTSIAAMRSRDASLLVMTLRYPSDVLGSLEVGSHLPATFPSPSELIVECFTRDRAYRCTPGHQAITLFGAQARLVGWQPDPADLIVAAFAAWLQGADGRPPGGLAEDVSALQLAERIRHSVVRGEFPIG